MTLGFLLVFVVSTDDAVACDGACFPEGVIEALPPLPPEEEECECTNPANTITRETTSLDECDNLVTTTETITTGGGGCCGAGTAGKPVWLYSGREMHTAVDLVVKGIMPIRMVRKYNSQSHFDSPMGYGWGFTLDKRLYKYADGSVIVRSDCGTRQRFMFNGLAYQAPGGLRSTLEENASGFILTKLRGAQELYDLEGRLTTVIDPQGNRLEMIYDEDGRLGLEGSSPYSLTPDVPALVAYDYRLVEIRERLVGGALTGNSVTLTYDDETGTDTGRLKEITASDGRQIIYTQDTSVSAKNGNLLTVNGLEDLVYNYVYDDKNAGSVPQDNHNLTSMQIGADTTPYVNKYDPQDRVIEQTHGHDIRTFDYDIPGMKTDVVHTVKNEAGTAILTQLTSNYLFNQNGNMVEKKHTLQDDTIYKYTWDRDSSGRTEHFTVFETSAEPGAEELTVKTIDYGYDGEGNLQSESVLLDSGEVVTTIRTFDHQWLESISTTSSFYPEEFRTEYTFYYSANDYPSNIKEEKRWTGVPDVFQTTTFHYSLDNGQIIRTVLPDGHNIVRVYDETTHDELKKTFHEVAPDAESDFLKFQFGYDAQNNLQQVINPRSKLSNYLTDDLGRTVKFTNALNEEVHLFYDPLYLGGTVLREIEIGRTATKSGQLVRFGYTPQGWLDEVEKQDGSNWLTVYSATYDSAGNKMSSTLYRDGAQLTTNAQYDALGRLVASTDPRPNLTQYYYDALSNLTVMIDAKDRETYFIYDDLDRLIKIERDKLDENAETFLKYDAVDNILIVTDAEGSETTFEYDALSRPRKLIQPMGAPHIMEAFYDNRNRIDYVINARGHKIDYGYEIWGGLTEVKYFPDSVPGTLADRTVSFVPDFNGNITGVTDTAIQLGELYSFTYDDLDRPDVVTAKYIPGNVALDSNYDRFGNRNQLSINDGAIVTFDYVYDLLNQLETIGFPGGQNPIVQYYEDAGDYRKIIHWSGITTEFEYEDNGPLKKILTAYASAAPIEQLDYEYDKVLNIEKLTSIRDTGDHIFGYDGLDHLTQAVHPAGQPQEDFDYDKVGNRENPLDGLEYDYNTNHQITQGPANVSYEFDDDGNLEKKTEGSVVEDFSHNKTNNLTGYTNGPVTAYYEYDPFARRLSKTVGTETTYFLWDAAKLLAEYDESGNILKRYHYLPGGLTPIQMYDADVPAVYDVHSDHLQTPKLLTDGNETIVWSQTQNAFGELNIAPGSVEFNLRFPGQYTDEESGLYYNLHRYYDPSLGRYIQSDPIGLQGGLNTYAYVGGNPLMYIDPYGLTKSCYRPLRAVPFAVIGTDGDKITNTVVGHEHIFFDDGTDVGFGGDGIYDGEDLGEYSQCEDIDAEKEEVEKVIDTIRNDYDPEDYKLYPRTFGGNNCQDFVDAIRKDL